MKVKHFFGSYDTPPSLKSRSRPRGNSLSHPLAREAIEFI